MQTILTLSFDRSDARAEIQIIYTMARRGELKKGETLPADVFDSVLATLIDSSSESQR